MSVVAAQVPVRCVLSVDDIAEMLEMRLIHLAGQPAYVAERARSAARLGLPAVICRPEHVTVAAKALGSTRVRICTPVDLYCCPHSVPEPRTLAENALRLTREGATCLAVVASAPRILDPRWVDVLAALGDVAGCAGTSFRVLVDGRGMALTQAAAVAVSCRDAGASVVQAGSWTTPHASFSLLRAFRQALGPEVRVKWTRPVRGVDALLLAVAEGADLFNADIEPLLADATRRQRYMPLSVPLPGHDYLARHEEPGPSKPPA